MAKREEIRKRVQARIKARKVSKVARSTDFTQTNPLLAAAIALLEARSLGMVTSAEWEALSAAASKEAGIAVPDWRTHDEQS